MNKAEIKKSMAKAIVLEENQLDDGTINWDFVDADVYMDILGNVELNDRDNKTFYKLFNEVATEFRASGANL